MPDSAEQKNSHGKKPLWQWVLLYISIAIVICGVIYLVFTRNGNKSSNYYERSSQQLHSPLPNKQSAINLREQNNSGETGKVAIKQDNGLFTITITVTGEPAKDVQPAFLQEGTCSDVGKVKLKLNPVKNGTSATTLQLSFDQLKKMEPMVVTVQKLEKDSKSFVTCSDISL